MIIKLYIYIADLGVNFPYTASPSTPSTPSSPNPTILTPTKAPITVTVPTTSTANPTNPIAVFVLLLVDIGSCILNIIITNGWGSGSWYYIGLVSDLIFGYILIKFEIESTGSSTYFDCISGDVSTSL